MADSGILKDTPPSSPNRENSLVHMIDVSTRNQEERHDDIFEKIDNYPSNTLASTVALSQDLPAGSSNRAVETLVEGAALLAGEQGEDSDGLPSYIVNSLPVSLTDSHL
ncbi:hypothetical protein LIER_14414 [Lithospermum erythrorhizon]|uniref:Uncharacterized protein n=1 Tax=Lithospermum erythrorhizon TaxID=34254 RepID=A0AAV3Q388_LITER